MKQTMQKAMGRTDVAAYLGVSRQYVDRIVKEEKIPFQETSAGTIFMENDVLAYKKQRTKKAKKDARIKTK
jgi:excisionase family DNA binding protein